MNRMVALLVGMSVVLPVQAQSLAEAVESAWTRHPQAVATSAREEEALARAEVAAGFAPGPASLSLSGLNDRLNRNRGKQEWEVEMAVPLWVPGQQAAREAEAASALAQVLAQRHAIRLQIAGEVRDAWWGVVAARSVRELAARRLATSRSLESDVLRRFRVGELSRIDANLARNERLSSEAELADAETALRQAEQASRNLTGLAVPTVWTVEKAVANRAAGDDHPQLRAAAAAAQLARARLKVAEENRREAPEFAVRVVRDRGGFAEPYAHTVGVKLTLPFSSSPRVRQDNAAARAELAQADAEMALAQRRQQLDTEKARLDLEAAERQLTMARQRRELTADNLTLAEKSFMLGESDLTSLLRVRTSAFEAEALLNRQEILRAASQSRLNQAMGVLP